MEPKTALEESFSNHVETISVVLDMHILRWISKVILNQYSSSTNPIFLWVAIHDNLFIKTETLSDKACRCSFPIQRREYLQ